MTLLPSSARARRRLRFAAGLALLAAAIWGLTLLLPAPERRSAEPTEAGAPTIVGREKEVPLRRADRQAIDRTLDAFLPAAVERKDLAAAYRLATPAMRRSATRAEWRRGDIPVYPYPASERHDWRLNFSFPKHVSLDLFVQPRKGADIGPVAFTLELRSFGRHRWLVDSIVPTATFPKVEDGGQPLAQPDLSPANVQGTVAEQRLSSVFFLIPVVLLGLALGVPFALFLVGKVREARAERLYALTPRRTMPPLPTPRRSEERERERSLAP